MQQKFLWGYAHGKPGEWEAICVDFDIAVQGTSFDEVRAMLNEAVASYVEDAMAEAPADRDRLLNRHAPLWVKFKFAAAFLAHISFGRSRSKELQAGFDIPCPA